MEAISLKCPHCGAVLTVPDMYVGRTSKCGRCRHDVAIRMPGHLSPEAIRANRDVQFRNRVLNFILALLMILLLAIIIQALL